MIQDPVSLFRPESWYHVRDGDADARRLFDRHYSRRRYRDGRTPKKMAGPGQYMMLLTGDQLAVFLWRKFFDASGQTGVNCAIFRNEGAVQSSTLILAAEHEARRRWSADRFYTYVDPKRIRSSNPGACFKAAGWRSCGETKGGLAILEKHKEAT